MPFDALSIPRKLKGQGWSGCHKTNPVSQSTVENIRPSNAVLLAQANNG